MYGLTWGFAAFMLAIDGVPRSIILINWVISILAISGLRIIAHKLLNKNFTSTILSKNNSKKVLIYGAGSAGVQLVSALEISKEYHPVGFIDDSKDLQGNQVRGLHVYSIDKLDAIINKKYVDEILIAIPSTSRAKRIEILNILEPFPVLVRILPGVSELALGKVSINDLREVDIKDLLGRNEVKPNKNLLGKNINNKSVVVTGAGGSIGSELCRQIFLLKPKKLILFEINELALYNIEKELSNLSDKSLKIYPILGNVNNKKRLIDLFKLFEVDTIYHTAA